VIICVYALVDAVRPLRGVAGLRGEPLRVIRVNRVAAIVGELARRPAPSTRNLRRYAMVVESIATRAPAILPARFGTTFDDAEELMFVLRSRDAAMHQRLRTVRRRAQMTIRLVGSDPGDPPLRGQTPVTSRGGGGPPHQAPHRKPAFVRQDLN
jgi:hypothetical protein